MSTGNKLLLAVLILFLIIGVCLGAFYLTGHLQYTGTTKDLKGIILDRCNIYKSKNPAIRADCNEIWEELLYVVEYKDPCNIKQEDYNHLMELTKETIPCDQTLLWSKLSDIVQCFTKKNQNYKTIEDTFVGFLFDGLTWCGSLGSPGMNFQSCPKWNKCENTAVKSFWKKASASFAEKSCGEVHIMLDGSKSEPIGNILQTIEIPNLNPTVKSVEIWAIDDRMSCLGENFSELRRAIESRNFQYFCTNSYRPKELLTCVKAYSS